MMVVLTIAIAALYALPNIYGEDPAIQITGARGASVNMSTLDSVTQALDQKSLSYKSIALEDGSILVRFNDTDAQISARDVINEALGRDNIVALNLAPATPNWLDSIGAAPLKLGLDLRGGVHLPCWRCCRGQVRCGAAIECRTFCVQYCFFPWPSLSRSLDLW